MLFHLHPPSHLHFLWKPKPRTITNDSKFSFQLPRISISATPRKLVTLWGKPSLLIPRCNPENASPASLPDETVDKHFIPITRVVETSQDLQQGVKKNFWGAVTLVIGTAVGPGMLGLPAATMKAGALPSTIAIVLCWLYVISSIILVAELSFDAMQEDGVSEVSFTGLATRSLGRHFGPLVAVVYASLNFALLVACVSGIGSILSQWLPMMNPLVTHGLFPLSAGVIIAFFPFNVIDTANRFLCLLMVFSITALVTVGLYVARANVLSSFARSSWRVSSILPAVPVAVLTLGFHVITPFICKIAGNTVSEARKAVLIGGAVPLIMVLSWNLIVLGLARVNNMAASTTDPISLLLSVNPSALPAVQGFAFSALATSLIGYALSFPKQLLDTLDLIFGKADSEKETSFTFKTTLVPGMRSGQAGLVVFAGADGPGNPGMVIFDRSRSSGGSEVEGPPGKAEGSAAARLVMAMVLGVPIIIGSFFPSTFSRAVDFAGVYANCFLFGILPPVMAYIQQSRHNNRSSSVPGGNMTLLALFTIAVMLLIWH
ncbi:unnamed protein product [Linum trigynum]|uniref:Tryptophan/tyrosine permease n=1 Tax=Linum trigynum TaxID=586398 RepID=A0AAV2E8E2_9ROSI